MRTTTTHIGDLKVVIVDDAVDAPAQARAHALACSLPFHRIRYGYRSAPGATPRHDHMWAHLVTDDERAQLPLAPLHEAVAEHFGALVPRRTHINCIQAGERRHPHIDAPHADLVVGVAVLNERWERDWHGELSFYDGDDIALTVAPRPGRLVLFHGRLLHRGGVPIPGCPEVRYALVQKYTRAA